MLSVIFLFYLFGWSIHFFAGLLWWSGLLQQKEYRLDRLHAHLNSLSSRQVILHLLPSLALVRPMTFKRPVKTLRVKLLLVSCLLFVTLSIYLLIPWLTAVPALVVGRLFVLPVLLYFFTPVVLLFLTIAMNGVVWLLTTYYLHRVRDLLRTKKVFIIGITGSFGKTTTKQLLAHVLAVRGSVCTTPGSVNTALGIARYLLKNLGTAETLVLEYAAYCPGEIARLTAVLPPDLAILTGLGKQHLELFGSQERIAQAKAELLEALPEKAKAYCVNESALKIVAAAKNHASLQVEKTWLAKGPKVATAIIGDHYRNTIRAVRAVAQNFGLSEKQITTRLESFVPTEKWIRTRTTKSGTRIIDDGGTSNPDGFSAALQLLGQQVAPRKILLTSGIIDLGTESGKVHTKLAHEATAYVSEVWYLGEVGKQAFVKQFATTLFASRAEILQRIQTLSADTVVLVEGRMPQWVVQIL